MFFNVKNHFYLILIIIFIILISCKLQEPTNNHGIVFLKNRSDKLVINFTNKNDVINTIGQPHSKSINSNNEWIYIERVLTKGEYHKLGRNVLKTNNVLVLNFDKYGVLKSKKFLNKDNKQKVKFSEAKTESQLKKKSFTEKFLTSIKEKMYGGK